jgi:ankyrin repeat protein
MGIFSDSWVRVVLISGKVLHVSVLSTSRVSDLKDLLEALSATPARYQRLFLKEIELANDARLEEVGLLRPGTEATLIRLNPKPLSLMHLEEDSALHVQYLIECGANPDEHDNRDRTALLWAVKKKRTVASLAILKVASSSTVNKRDPVDRGTALHWAARLNLVEVCQALSERQDFTAADARDTFGLTALDWARQEGHAALISVLAASEQSGKTRAIGDVPRIGLNI